METEIIEYEYDEAGRVVRQKRTVTRTTPSPWYPYYPQRTYPTYPIWLDPSVEPTKIYCRSGTTTAPQYTYTINNATA